MSFAETYGTFAKDFIHVHHITSLSEISDSYEVNPETDLIPVCPNCHAMLHRQENGIPMKVDRLKLLFEVSKNSK
jgi:5-methylcytosine-specific restriction protein A